MLKVLFADDEPLMLEGLRFLVDWEELDFEVCGEALDGEDALQLIHSTRPDLVITDVRMPVIDGLELIKKFAESDFQPKFIIFSGYADFEYAKEALRYGVSNYLTKPLDERELTEALQTVAEQIRAERKLASRREAVSAFIQAETVSRLLMRENTAEEVEEALKTLNIHPGSRICCVLAQGDSLDSSHLRRQVYSLSVEEMFINITAYPFMAGTRKYGYLLVFPAEGPELDRMMLASWINEMRTQFSRQVLFSVSLEHTGTTFLNTAYNEALAAELCRPDVNTPEISFFQKQDKDQMALLPAGMKKSLLQSVTEGQLEPLSSQLSDVFKIFSADSTSSAWIDAFLSNIKAELLREIEVRGGEPAIWADKWFPPRVTACCLPLLERQTMEDLHEVAEWFASADNNQEDTLVTAAIDYVRAHYQEKLKLQDIAKHLHVNSAYLGQRIKKRYGISFNEFLHKYRIEKAKKLLRRTDMCISDISGRVGYSDADLFAAKFKALNGVSPSVYKKG
ncbi:Protein-glutamate methylesterase/protein-glutamine glutaminase [Paenibacillus auburnensis]|uniref:Protein-glutamate methylesterase/protein-glutamine glutaminase n=1 Tax=Paenibacillus auburnensis TaxID=2905649 RepID=A0ABN8GFP5_9BACL|nr:response regulator transcription factor [Paenibacillus auburnensis]CAH1207848.1 Protein-glutamate methylesterase/protein-glutamine glutaminase [Paenibacillus auburnensis]